MQHRPAQRVRVPEQLRDQLHLPGGERVAHAGRGDPVVVVLEQRHRDHLEAEIATELGDPRGVALATAAEVEVLAHHEEPHLRLLDEQPHEVERGDLLQLRGELQHRDEVDAERADQLDAVLERLEVRERDIGADDGDGVGVEGDDAGAEVAGAGLVDEALDQHPVALVHAVEDADRERMRSRGDAAAQLLTNE